MRRPTSWPSSPAKVSPACACRRTAARVAPGARFEVELPWPRKIASAVFTAFVTRLMVTGVVDTQCGIKGFRAAAAERLFRLSVLNSFTFDVEVLYLAFKLNL